MDQRPPALYGELARKNLGYYDDIEMRGNRIEDGYRLTPSHLPQESHMRGYRIPYPGKFDIDQPVFLAGLPDDLADGRIMHMRYFREKMMLDLEVQPSDQPGHHGIIRSEIGRRLDLVYRPFVFQFTGLYIGNGKSSMLDRVRQLKYQAQYKTGYTGKYNEPNQPVGEPKFINRQSDK